MQTRSQKRCKKSSRTASPPPKPCPIQNLPLEILERCVGGLDADSLYSLASTSRIFYRTFRSRAVLGQLEDAVACGGNGKWSGNLFCLADATGPDDFGWAPFFMMLDDEHLCDDGDDQEFDYRGPSLSLSALAPDLVRFEKDSPTPDYLFIRWTKHEVWLHCEYFEDAFTVDLGEEVYLDWDSEVAGRLVRATPELLRQRFTYPECEGSTQIVVGTKAIETRWPDLTASPYHRYDIPCPRCTISYEHAVELQAAVNAEVEAEIEAEMQKEIEAEMEEEFRARFEEAMESGEFDEEYFRNMDDLFYGLL